jgi:hypothetical protein
MCSTDLAIAPGLFGHQILMMLTGRSEETHRGRQPSTKTSPACSAGASLRLALCLNSAGAEQMLSGEPLQMGVPVSVGAGGFRVVSLEGGPGMGCGDIVWPFGIGAV